MSSGEEKRAASFRDLVEEAKKRIIVLVICVVGLSYLMSLTSPSVLVNLPAALLLIIVLRYMSLELETRRKAATYKGKATPLANSSERRLFTTSIDRSEWKNKVNSTVVEEAIEQFNRHIVSEWVTDLWYSRITPDRQGPEELVLIMNGVLGEISSRFRNINLIDFITRDIIRILCVQLELFRECKTKIEKQQSKLLTDEERDIQLKSVLAAENKLHPILFSAEAEHKVLQHVMDGLILLTFKKEDLQCSLFRYIVRELLACVVIRPVLNLVNPRFINERIEALVISSAEKKTEGSKAATSKVTTHANINAPLRILSDDISQSSPDPSMKGVELVRLKKDENPKDPLLAMATRSTRSWNSLPEVHNNGDGRNGKGIERHHSGGEWGDMLDVFSRKKTEALAPEHFDNMWAKGKDYKTNPPTNTPVLQVHNSSLVGGVSGNSQERKNVSNSSGYSNKAPAMQGKPPTYLLNKKEDYLTSENSDDGEESWSSSSSFSKDDDDTSTVTGLDTPGVKVWDGRSKRNFSRIHHPLETFDGKKKMSKGGHLHANKGLHRTKSAKKRSKSSTSHNSEHVWQEVQRSSFKLGEGKDLLNSSKSGDLSEDSEVETLGGRTYSGATTASSMSFTSLTETVAASSAKRSIISDSYFTLRCEVFGANIVKSGSKTFAVYCIFVTDVNNKNWSIKRRFQHFEELHRRLKEFPDYNLHLPPKHFLSTGPDKYIIQERCKLLDQYLKKLLQLPTVSCSIEVWDFLSVDSQMYIFSDSLSIIETLSVDTPDTVREKSKEYWENPGDRLSNGAAAQDSVSVMKGDHHLAYGSRLKAKDQSLSSSNKLENEFLKDQKNVNPSGNLDKTIKIEKQASSHSVETANDTTSDSTIPSEWIPPSLSVPILDLVDVILQLKDGGWIRRKAFWVAKQVLQLGMGDAFDDWLIEKIQLLRRGSVIASGVRRLEQILWPDGIFITKHPRRQQPSPPVASPSSSNSPCSSPKANENDVQQMEAERRAKFVYELMIDKAPAAIVGLVGSKEYEQCAKDLYYFIQSSVCMKLLTFNILEQLLSSAFPELDRVFKQLTEEKEKFGKFELSA